MVWVFLKKISTFAAYLMPKWKDSNDTVIHNWVLQIDDNSEIKTEIKNKRLIKSEFKMF